MPFTDRLEHARQTPRPGFEPRPQALQADTLAKSNSNSLFGIFYIFRRNLNTIF
jgi:hypothetical protein